LWIVLDGCDKGEHLLSRMADPVPRFKDMHWTGRG